MIRYTVKKGDSLESIAIKHFGSTDKVKDIISSNPALPKGKIYPGAVLTLNVNSITPRNLKQGVFSVYIDGKSFEYFNTASGSNTFDCLADGVKFKVENTQRNRDIFIPFKAGNVSCFYGSEQLVSGQVFDNQTSIAELDITVYNYAQHLATCNYPTSLYPRTHAKSSLHDFCRKISPVHNVSFDVTPVARFNFNRRFDNLVIKEDETLADFLIKTARERDLIIKPNNKTGGLIFDVQTSDDTTLDLVKEKLYNGLTTRFNGESLYKTLTGIKPITHDKKEQYANIHNNFVEHNRHFVKAMSSGSAESLTDFIKNQNKAQLKRCFKTNIEYPDIVDTKGRLIKAGQTVLLENDSFYIYRATPFIILSCSYNFDSKTTSIELQPKDIFEGKPIKTFWEKK